MQPASQRAAALAAIDGSGFDEAERVAPRIVGVEGALAPGLDADIAAAAAMHLAVGVDAERPGAGVDGVEILHREVERLGRRMRLGNAYHLQRDGAAVEIDTIAGLWPGRLGEKIAIEFRSGGDIAHFEVEAEHLRDFG